MKTPFLTRLDLVTPTATARRRAFSLVEVTLALGIVTFGLVGVVGVLPTALASGRQSFDQNRAAAIANTLFASFRSQPFQKVGYLDVQFDGDGKPLASPGVPMLDLNSTNPSQSVTASSAVQFHATFTGDVVSAAQDTYSRQRGLSFTSAPAQAGMDYLVTMYFNNQPDGMIVVPKPGSPLGSTPIVPAQANQIELVISAVSQRQNQYHFVSTIANRLN